MNQSYRYRSVFNDRKRTKDESLNKGYRKGTKYLIDPFSGFLKENYISEIFQAEKKQLLDVKKQKYIFYSLFDIDVFVRKNYRDDSSDDSIKYTFNRINDVFTDRRISFPFFWNNDKKVGTYGGVYNNLQIYIIKELLYNPEVKPNFPTSKLEAIEVIDIIIDENSEAIDKKEINELVEARDDLAKSRTKLAPRIKVMEKIFNTKDKIKVLNEAMKVVKQ